MSILSISEKKCRKCYRCVQGCPTNTLNIDRRKVKRVEYRCIYCGDCLKYCPHDAVIVHTGVNEVLDLLAGDEKVIACLDPAFPAVLDIGTPGQIVTSLKKLGFDEVWESAGGGDLVVDEYKKYLKSSQSDFNISSFCPSVVLYIEKYVPHLIDHLMPIVSPMIATGKMIKEAKGKKAKVVFIGPCLSRIWERSDQNVSGWVDFVLTYHDISAVLNAKGIDRKKQTPSNFDGPIPRGSRLMSITRGLCQCMGFEQSLLNLEFAAASTSAEVKRTIQQLLDRTLQAKFIELLFCRGCIDGPSADKNISAPGRRRIVANFITSQQKKHNGKNQSSKKYDIPIDLKRKFSSMDAQSSIPDDDEIKNVLKDLRKSYPNQNLDCGACGHETCHNNAIAIIQGFSKLEMCPHYLTMRLKKLFSKLEKSHIELKNSHGKLAQAQRQLIHSEKMASIGQLAAGVAHELNNPLGTIILFGRLLQKEIAHDKKWDEDINLIIKEADRAAKIVKDLLSFSRETKIKTGLVNINILLEEALSLLEKQSLFLNIETQKNLDSNLPTTYADADLLKQVFLNILINGAQAMTGEGYLKIKTASGIQRGKDSVHILIEDSGKGIPPENLERLFDPFFTTKEKGTGLGLAIAYGIISRHKGNIDVKSKINEGTVIRISLPILNKEEWIKGKNNGKKGKNSRKKFESQNLIG